MSPLDSEMTRLVKIKYLKLQLHQPRLLQQLRLRVYVFEYLFVTGIPILPGKTRCSRKKTDTRIPVMCVDRAVRSGGALLPN